jgi:Putative Flp pilus-assembly TadE/G-like
MKSRIWSIHRDEQGATLAFVAVIIFVLIGVTALAVDFGALYFDRRRMVNAADAAALAAAITYAKKDATCGSNDTPAQTQADSLATANTSTANPDNRPGQTAYTVDCATKTVTVQYFLDHDYYFAGAIGFDSTPVVARATAHWGPAAGAGGVLPIMINMGRLSTCDIPGTVEGTECWFYVDNNALSNASWALMNVQPNCGDGKYGWNVSSTVCPSRVSNPDPTYNCPTFSNQELQAIVNSGSPPLSMRTPPQPTYVCTVTGNHASVFDNMASLQGQLRLFPVNDETKQILSGGIPCPWPCPNTQRMMFAIVGFIQMRVLDVWKGSGNSGWDLANCPGPKKGSAYCLHIVWEGYTFEPGPICDTCQEFGVDSVLLKG